MTKAGFLDKLEPRERRLMIGLMAVVAVLLVLVGPFLALRSVSKKNTENQELRDLIATVGESRGVVEKKRAKQSALLKRYAKPAPKLAGFIDEIARENGLTAEAVDKPDVPHGKRYTEKLTTVKMHKVGLRPLVKVLEKIEQSGYPVAVTRLKVQPRASEADSYEVELGVSAFDRKPDAAPVKPGASASASASASAKPAGGKDDDEEEP